MAELPLVMAKTGLQPRQPADIRDDLTTRVAAVRPGYTHNLPGSLIEDIASTDVAAVALMEQARIEFVNSLTPYAANPYLLSQIGQMKGVVPGQTRNTMVQLIFYGTPGFVIDKGFVVSDGIYQYVVADGGIIGASTQSELLTAYASESGSWAVPSGTVQELVTSVPSEVALSVNNPYAGVPSAAAETIGEYRARVFDAEMAAATGMPSFLRTALSNVPGVPARLVSAVQVAALGRWKILVGGAGDPYQIAYAIFSALFNINSLIGSTVDQTRTVDVSINDYPDTYVIPYVAAPEFSVSMSVIWDTLSTNVVSSAAVAQLAAPAIADYVNSIVVGKPLNIYTAQATFVEAVSPIIPSELLTRINFSVAINGSAVSAISNTGIIESDPEAYFSTDYTKIHVMRG